MKQGLEIWIDRGGTFTDVIVKTPDGRYDRFKLLSENPGVYEDAAVEGVRRALGLAPGEPVDPKRLTAVKMGTTVATNALLERTGAKTLFLTTRGFKDCLLIGDQTRPDIFALDLTKPPPLYALACEVDERIAADGSVLTPLDEAGARARLAEAKAQGVEAVAVALLHSVENPAHEERIGRIARELGFAQVSLSHETDPRPKLIPRAATTVADAYLTPGLRAYVDRIARALGGASLSFMTSSGALASAERFRGRDAVLSGPAGGVVGMARTGAAAGFPKVIGFDMGGTSSDVSRADGDRFERAETAEIAGVKLRTPMVGVHTVAAGGGSRLIFDGERARVGPQSAGAHPGPACYGKGGPAALTDANVVLGRIDPRRFPAVFGPRGDQPLDAEAANAALSELARDMGLADARAAAEGFFAVAIEHMAQAIKQISTAKGVDPRGYALNAFGGAAAQHACAIAHALGMTNVLVHPFASVLSAFGVGLAQEGALEERACRLPLDAEAGPALERLAQAATDAACARLTAKAPVRTRMLRAHYEGSDTILSVDFSPDATAEALRHAFETAHRRLFGFVHGPDRDVIVDAVRVEVTAETRDDPVIAPSGGERTPQPADWTTLRLNGADIRAPIFTIDAFGAGAVVEGPALIIGPDTQIVVEPGWMATRLEGGALLLRHTQTRPAANATTALDPIRLELFNKRFMSVAEQMGVVLAQTAHSVNIKERLDFSCAVFDPRGGLVANAPHMPVHLGSMGASVRAALSAHPDLAQGDAVAVNAPYNGGTHLPDVTVIAPVADPETGERVCFVAARGHHADIGGVQPGSMPPFSTTIAEQGVILDGLKILDQGVLQEADIRRALADGHYPARNPDQTLADLQAQLAACAAGSDALAALMAEHGRPVVEAYMGHVQANAEAAVRRVLARLPSGSARVRTDTGAEIAVALHVDRDARAAVIDFTGTAAQSADNMNAPAAVARAAALYVFRCLAGDDIPLNDGCLTPLDIRIPKASLLNPEPPAAVVAGNVETSQLVTDALFLAAGVMAAAQGTMNNLTFGDAQRQYYETICGGAGAGADFDGADAIHTHMTNSRLTDPEILERRFPVRVLEHRIRVGSGGAGARRGGHGGVRRFEFLAPLEVALLSNRRVEAPPGLNGGAPGRPGAQRLLQADGTEMRLDGRFQIRVHPGDQLEIETPGGGGCGAPLSSS
ncbi:MAG: hydantoinase B/oxoprolinase family protein [Maricaulaceae bacterium]